jgi:hypothetical protein
VKMKMRIFTFLVAWYARNFYARIQFDKTTLPTPLQKLNLYSIK